MHSAILSTFIQQPVVIFVLPIFERPFYTLVNVYVDLVVFTRIAGTS